MSYFPRFLRASRRSSLAALFLLASAACSNGRAVGGTESTSSGDGGAPSGSSAGGSGGQAETGGGGASHTGVFLELPAAIDLPYVDAGEGGSSVTVLVHNTGDADAPIGSSKLSFSIAGDARITLVSAPEAIPAHGSGAVELAFEGADVETIALATLSLATAGKEQSAPVFAVAGDPDLGVALWEELHGPGGVVCGEGTTVEMPAAPYPDGSGSFTDPSVQVFVPEGYRDTGDHHLVVHFHGWGATLDSTLAAHRYREHLYASGANAILVVPQGPVEADSGDFGKLMEPEGLANLTRQVLVLLYREGAIASPVLGELWLTSHSGGYDAVATNLISGSLASEVTGVGLYDSMYGYASTFEAFVNDGGLLRSDYTASGGTDGVNQTCAEALEGDGVAVADAPTPSALRDDRAVVFFADTTHQDSTRIDGAFGEALRWGMRRSRRGPRVDLREVTAKGGTAKVRWFAPHDDDVTGYVVQTSPNGSSWTTAVEVAPNASGATFSLSGGVRVRVVPNIPGVDDPLASDVYRVDDGAKILVVDGFDRVLDGAYGGLAHPFAALVGEAAGEVATIGHRAITEDAFDLSAYPTVVWVLGDESVSDHSMTAEERAVVSAYVNAGGHLVVSGSELAYDLAKTTSGKNFLSSVFGATYASDASGSYTAVGQGALAGLASFAYGGATAPYTVAYPDVLTATGGGEIVLDYGSGTGAAVGIEGRAVLAGFPLEIVAAPRRASVVRALVKFARGS